MFDVGFSELLILFVIGLLILGPERLPRVASQLGRWVGRARRTAHQLRMQLEREMALSEVAKKAHPPPKAPPREAADEPPSNHTDAKSQEPSREGPSQPSEPTAGTAEPASEERNAPGDGP
jgi:sec-independent protein translocase protein TatB